MRALLALLLVTATACSPRSHETTLTVFAAASLKTAFLAEGKAFEAAHPGVRVVFSFAGSQSLVAQLRQGAPADALATADVETMTSYDASLHPAVFAHNQLAILTPRGNPLGIRTVADLSRPGLKVVLAGPAVPVGKAAASALAAARVTVRPVSLEDGVAGVVSKVRLGEADAGIGYASDLRVSHGALAGVLLADTRTDLAIAALNARARAFVDFVTSDAGQQVLRTNGFS